MKTLELNFLEKINACESGINWYKEQGVTDIKELLQLAIKHDKLIDASWCLIRLMNKQQNVKYAVYAAEQVLSIFEERYPDNNKPRKAIEAAKKYIQNPCRKTKDAANAASAAASAAAYTAFSDAAADAAAYAAAAADADAADAAYAADAAADAAAYAVAAADLCNKQIRIKILQFGVSLIYK